MRRSEAHFLSMCCLILYYFLVCAFFFVWLCVPMNMRLYFCLVRVGWRVDRRVLRRLSFLNLITKKQSRFGSYFIYLFSYPIIYVLQCPSKSQLQRVLQMSVRQLQAMVQKRVQQRRQQPQARHEPSIPKPKPLFLFPIL